MLACLIQCSSEKNNYKKIQDVLAIEKDQPGLSDFTRVLGVNELVQQKIDDVSVQFLIRGESSDVNNSYVDLNNSILSLSLIENDSYKLTLNNDNYIVVNNDITSVTFNGNVINDSILETLDERQLADINNLIILFIELTDCNLERSSESEWMSTKSDFLECYFTGWGIRESRSFSKYTSETVAKNFITSNPGCRQIGNTNSSCIWGDHMCVSSVTIACTGDKCK